MAQTPATMKALRQAVLAGTLLMAACSSAPAILTPAAPTATPTAARTASPTQAATASATELATATATAEPTATASAEPSAGSPSPSASASASAAAGGLVESVAGGGTDAPANGLPIAAVALQRPVAIAFAPDGTWWVVDANAGMLLHVLADGTLSDVTGGLGTPSGVTVTPGGKVYLSERSNYRMSIYNGHGGVDVAGGDEHVSGSSGDGGPFNKALFAQPTQVVSDGAGNLYINDLFNEKIRWVDATTNVIDRVAGNGTTGFSGDNGPAKDAQISRPLSLVVDAGGTQLVFGDGGNARLRSVDLSTGEISTIGGTGSGSVVAFDPTLTAKQTALIHLSALAFDNGGNIYLPVQWGDLGLTIERLAPDGTLTRLVGGGANEGAGSGPLDTQLGDVLCLGVNPANGDLLYCAPDSHIYNVPGAAAVAGP
jgi:hypothetical protein